MIGIDIIQDATGLWTGKFIEGYLEHEVQGFDREEVLMELLRRRGYALWIKSYLTIER